MVAMSKDERIAQMSALLDVAKPMMRDKCCHFEWCEERRGVVSNSQAEGFHEIEGGMHPGCAPYRRWLDTLAVVQNK